MSELALGWTQAKYNNIITLIGTTNPSHLESSIKAVQTEVNKETIESIENLIAEDSLKGIIKRKWIFTNGVGKLA